MHAHKSMDRVTRAAPLAWCSFFLSLSYRTAGFINPFSYQTNLMVYVAGNYRTREFAKIGAPFQLYLLIVSSFILCFMDYWTVVWIVSFVVAGAVIIPPFLWEVLPAR